MRATLDIFKHPYKHFRKVAKHKGIYYKSKYDYRYGQEIV